MSIDLRQGRWEEALADVDEVDALITDPPYSERTHDAQRTFDARKGGRALLELQYASWTAADVAEMVNAWARRVRGWWVVFSDHDLQRAWESSLERAGLYVFAPIPQVTLNRSVRLCGDGPATWTTWITVARPRSRAFQRWAPLPGAYVDGVGQRAPGVVRGAKQLHTMRALVRDYSRPGDLICDPCAGGATTLLAAAIEGRRAIGAEVDPDTYARAQVRIAQGYTMTLALHDPLDAAVQGGLFEGGTEPS